MESNQLNDIFFARSVAIIGASTNETKRGYRAIETLLREKYEGKIYPVNPRLDTVLGLKCYHNIMEIREDVDVALITTPAESIPGILEECSKKNVKGAVIISGGFGELGTKGKQKEKEIAAIAAKNNIRIIGPNTSGMMSLHNKLNLVGIQDVPKGDIALLSQSGNIALHIITEAGLRSNVGFSHYVGVGNEADLKFHEYLKYFEDDKSTKAIVMYVEGMREGRSFLQQAYQTTRKKPIILLKSGRTATGMRSAGSHTGALAGISEVARTAFRRAGIITIDNLDELFPVTETLASLPPIHKNRVAILADGGGTQQLLLICSVITVLRSPF
jgi:acetyltransferase